MLDYEVLQSIQSSSKTIIFQEISSENKTKTDDTNTFRVYELTCGPSPEVYIAESFYK